MFPPNMPIRGQPFNPFLLGPDGTGPDGTWLVRTLNLRSGWPNSPCLRLVHSTWRSLSGETLSNNAVCRVVRLVGIQEAVADRGGRIESACCVDGCCLERSVMCVCASCGAGEMDGRVCGVGVVLDSSAAGWARVHLCVAFVPCCAWLRVPGSSATCAAFASSWCPLPCSALSRESHEIQTPNAASLLTLEV
ncbi:hypothetical protein L1887_60844 [Cichorium endivia]|nr:hypothetical protein L1887_60844 [Cichorium endivia]